MQAYAKTDPTLNQVNNQFLDLPIFNKYFVIRSSNTSTNGFGRPSLEENINLRTSLYNLAGMTSNYSTDFHQFVQTDVVSILGRSESKNVKSLIKNKKVI